MSCIVRSVKEAIGLNIQAAIVSSPTVFHIEQSIELASAGIHMLIEKPLSVSMLGVEQLMEKIHQNRCIVNIGYVLRYDDAARRFKQLLHESKIGKITNVRIECGSYLPDWRPTLDYKNSVSALPELGGGVLLELSHELDYMHWFFGVPVSVYANLHNSKTLGVKVEDQANLLMQSREGYPLTVQIDFHRRHPTRVCNVQTTNGELTWNAVKKSVSWLPVNGDKSIEYFECEKDYVYTKQLKCFIGSNELNYKPIVSLQDGLNVMKLVNAARESDRMRMEVFL